MTTEVAALLAKAASSRRAAALLAAQDYLDFAASRAYYALLLAEDRRIGLCYNIGDGIEAWTTPGRIVRNRA